MYANLFEKYRTLQQQLAALMQGSSLTETILVYAQESRLFQTSSRKGIYDQYILVAFFKDATEDSANTGEGISVVFSSPAEANGALLLQSCGDYDGSIVGAISPSHEFLKEGYLIGQGFETKSYRKGTRVPNGVNVYRIWLSDGHVEKFDN